MYDVDVTVIGAGAVGLACAVEQAKAGRRVLVLERSARIGDGISSRNSEVINSGLYYQTGSLKHLLCVQGRDLLYTFLDAYHLPYHKCGKIVVATSAEERSKLEELQQRGLENGLDGLTLLDAHDVARLEPDLTAVCGLLVPQTGIFDSHQFFLALASVIGNCGGDIVLRTLFQRAEVLKDGFRVFTGGDEPLAITTRLLINSAGLSAPRVSAAIDALSQDSIPLYNFARGSYFRLSGPTLFPA